MTGHQALIDLRRKGYAPAGGVVIDLGVVSYDWGTWKAENSPTAFLRSELGELPDLRCITALPALIRVAPEATNAQVKAFTEHAATFKPKALGVVRFDDRNQPETDDQGRVVAWSFSQSKWAKGWPEGVAN